MTSVTTIEPAAINEQKRGVIIRAAEANEATALFRLISDNLESGHLLPRPLGEIVLHIPRFHVAVQPTGEVRSLVVRDDYRGQGLGKELLSHVVEAARQQGYSRMSAFAHNPRTFINLGFSIVPHHWIPDKISTDCHSCIWFRKCTQYALILDLNPGACQ